jgi:chromosome segregation ATPase
MQKIEINSTEEFKSIKRENDDLKELLDKLGHDIKVLKEKNSILNKRFEKLEIKNKKLEHNNGVLKKKNSHLKKVSDEVLKKVNYIDEQLHERNDRITYWKKRFSDLKDEKDNIRRINKELNKENSHLKEHFDNLDTSYKLEFEKLREETETKFISRLDRNYKCIQLIMKNVPILEPKKKFDINDIKW